MGFIVNCTMKSCNFPVICIYPNAAGPRNKAIIKLRILYVDLSRSSDNINGMLILHRRFASLVQNINCGFQSITFHNRAVLIVDEMIYCKTRLKTPNPFIANIMAMIPLMPEAVNVLKAMDLKL